MNLFNFFRKLFTRRGRKESPCIKQNLRKTPHEEMFKSLRKEGGIKSIHELWETKQLSPEILNIWEQTIDEMFLISLNFDKIRKLCDTKHLYFVPHNLYDNWDDRLKFFMKTLAGLDSLNSFSIINPFGSIIFLNPLGEPIDTSHDEAIKNFLLNFFENFNKNLKGAPNLEPQFKISSNKLLVFLFFI